VGEVEKVAKSPFGLGYLEYVVCCMKTDWILENYSGSHTLLKIRDNFMQNSKLISCMTQIPVFQVIRLVANRVSLGFILSCSSRHETGLLKKSVLNNRAVYESVCLCSLIRSLLCQKMI